MRILLILMAFHRALFGVEVQNLCSKSFQMAARVNFFTQEGYLRLATDETGGLVVPGGKVLPFPLAIQPNNADCGVTTTQTVLAYFGQTHDHLKLREALGTDPEIGTDFYRMVDFLKGKGMKVEAKVETKDIQSKKVQGQRMTSQEIERAIQQEKPVIVLLQAYAPSGKYESVNEFGHYAVIIGADKDNFYFMDPNNHGNFKYLPKREFEKRWHALDNETDLMRGAGIIVSADAKNQMAYNYSHKGFARVPTVTKNPSPGAAVAYSLIDYFKLDFYQDDVQKQFALAAATNTPFVALQQVLAKYDIKHSAISKDAIESKKLTVLHDAHSDWFGILLGKQKDRLVLMDPNLIGRYNFVKPKTLWQTIRDPKLLQINSKRPRNIRFEEVSFLD